MKTPAMAPVAARLREYRMLWHAAVMHTNPRLTAVVRWGTFVLAILVGMAVAYTEGPRAALVLGWAGAFSYLLLEWVCRFVPGAVMLNAPANAKLVPRMRRRLVELSCLVCLVGLAGIASAPYADAGKLGAWLFWVVVFTVGTGLSGAGHKAGSAIVTAALFGWLLIDRVSEAMIALLSDPLVLLLSLPLYAGIIVVAVRAMFPEGGERHWDMLARRTRWASAGAKANPLAEQLAGKPAKGWYGASLRRASARRDGGRLMLHALGPTHHLGEIVAALGMMALVVLGIGFLTTGRIDSEVLPGLGWLFAFMLLFVPVMHAVRLGQLAGKHDEQALVRLAPAVPAGASAFNVRLGQSLVLQALVGWLLTTGMALLLAALGGAGPDALLRTASLCCMVLPVIAVPLRDHASRKDHAAVRAATLLLISVVESTIAGGVVNAFTAIPVLPVAALASIGFTVYVVLRGLRTMRHSPCAFPAGRMD